MASTSEMQDKLLDIRFAFERDMVRRKGDQAFQTLRVIIGLCVVCGEDFDKTHYLQNTCSLVCRKERANQRQLEYWHKQGKENPSYQWGESEEERPVDPMTNLMVAILEQAVKDGATDWLEANKELYTRAILGRRLDG